MKPAEVTSRSACDLNNPRCKHVPTLSAHHSQLNRGKDYPRDVRGVVIEPPRIIGDQVDHLREQELQFNSNGSCNRLRINPKVAPGPSNGSNAALYVAFISTCPALMEATEAELRRKSFAWTAAVT